MPYQLQFHEPDTNPSNLVVILVVGGALRGTSGGLEKDGTEPATWLVNLRHRAVVVTEYSCAENTKTPLGRAPIKDVEDAFQQVKQKFHKAKVGFMGWSAGAYLAAMAKCQTDFLILCYPVISMQEPIAHAETTNNLLGASASAEERSLMSAHHHVTNMTPPVYIFHTAEDNAVPVEHTMLFTMALHAKGVPFRVVITPNGEHGTRRVHDLISLANFLSQVLNSFKINTIETQLNFETIQQKIKKKNFVHFQNFCSLSVPLYPIAGRIRNAKDVRMVIAQVLDGGLSPMPRGIQEMEKHSLVQDSYMFLYKKGTFAEPWNDHYAWKVKSPTTSSNGMIRRIVEAETGGHFFRLIAYEALANGEHTNLVTQEYTDPTVRPIQVSNIRIEYRDI